MNLEIKIPESLSDDIRAIRSEVAELKNKLQQKKQPKYYTRQEVADLLNVNLTTIHNYTKRGIIIAYQISGRVLYKAEDIENAIVELQK